MTSLKSFVETLGGLHDAVVQKLAWNLEERVLRFEFKDIYIDFEGFPEYPGLTPGSVMLRKVGDVSFELDAKEGSLHVYEFAVENIDDDKWIASISFWPGGKITATFADANFPEIHFRSTT